MATVRDMNKVSQFTKPLPDMRKRAAMVDFLVKHERYADHNDPFQFSHCVKLHSLNIPRDLQDKAYQVLEMIEPFDAIRALFADFEKQHGQTIGFDGRSSGHLVLYSFDASESPAQLSEYDMNELRWLVRLVHAFDQCCDQAVALFMTFVTDYEIVTEKVYVSKTVSVSNLQPISKATGKATPPPEVEAAQPAAPPVPAIEVTVYRRDNGYWVVPTDGQSLNNQPLKGTIFERETFDPLQLGINFPIDNAFARLNASPVDDQEAQAVIDRLNTRYSNQFRLTAATITEEATPCR